MVVEYQLHGERNLDIFRAVSEIAPYTLIIYSLH